MPLSTEGIQYTFSIWLRTNNLSLNSEWNTAEDLRKQYVSWCAYYGENPDLPKKE